MPVVNVFAPYNEVVWIIYAGKHYRIGYTRKNKAPSTMACYPR